jgi:hypothetical protein
LVASLDGRIGMSVKMKMTRVTCSSSSPVLSFSCVSSSSS